MTDPEAYRRYSTRAAIDALAVRFGLPNDPQSQDWEYEVADASRLTEFLRALEEEPFTDDERFTLSEMIMQCFEDMAADQDAAALGRTDEWRRFVALLRRRPELHASTLCYWAVLESTLEDAWRVAILVRPLWAELEPAILRDRLREPQL